MPEPKKKTQPLTFDAQVDSLLEGMRLSKAMLPGAIQQSKTPDGNAGQPGGIQTPEPALVSKLIDFIKSI